MADHGRRGRWRAALAWAAAAGLATLATAGTAGELPGAAQAARMAPTAGRAELRLLHPELIEAKDRKLLARASASFKYFGAMAIVPGRGIWHRAAAAAVDYHGIGPARAAALAVCNARRAASDKPCVILADIVPKGWKGSRGLDLSQDASAELRGKFRRARRHKAFAISPATGNFGWAGGQASLDDALRAARAACADMGGERPKAEDCRAVAGE
ncbi:MAG: hypothetical protein D6832_07135 [Alphaproteobacteria bacterium]|nr:MAG: hypothetical protein D6832_07135 [Alphaproteobacteria bacterium]